jgi:L1 cell adhesion molecule like protein
VCYISRNEADKATAMAAIEDAIKWLEVNQLAELDEFRDKLKDLEAVCSPIMTRLYQQVSLTLS